MKETVEFVVNGHKVRLAVAGSETLLECLRDQLGLTGTKRGCDQGDCGACTVLMDGQPVNSCLVLAAEAGGKEITTIEGLSGNQELHPLQQAFVDYDAIQCGFCTPGVVLTAAALLRENPNPSEAEIRHHLQGNLCRCTGYGKLVQAVQAAARNRLRDEKENVAGNEIRRLDAPEKAAGAAVFPGDMKRPGMLICKILRSKIPHGHIRRIITEKALSLPGVAGVITARDFPDVRSGISVQDQTVMASGEGPIHRRGCSSGSGR